MQFDSKAYGSDVAQLLAFGGDGQRFMPLIQGPCSSPEAKQALAGLSLRKSIPEAALAGAYLYFSCWDEAHEIAQNLSSPEGSYWHAIVHRQEPDAFNSGYWFRQVGAHPIFPALREAASQIGVDFGPRWDPSAFIEMCVQASGQPGSGLERMAMRTQLAEWQLLFDYCAAKKARG